MANQVIIGSQWGDEGKAKIVDYLTQKADIVVRFQGGANAGHTVEVEDKKYVFHLVPSGIISPNIVCIIGNGVVLDPNQFLKELNELKQYGIASEKRIFISSSAHIVFPHHRVLDDFQESKNGSKAIGTTKRGIGPAYSDKINRKGIRAGDLFTNSFAKTLKARIEDCKQTIQGDYFNTNKEQLKSLLNYESTLKEYQSYAQQIKPFVIDTSVYLYEAKKQNKNILFEGAQGTFLDIDHGTHPFVTSSNTVAAAACTGSGVGPNTIDHVVGVVKAYVTRVGNGPFPTQIKDELGQKLQQEGNEFGATTGRIRRCGWFDCVMLRKAAMINGLTHLAITKIDVLDHFEEIKVCTAYNINGTETNYFPESTEQLNNVKPIYQTFKGWNTSTKKINSWEQLPENAKTYLKFISDQADVTIGLVSFGPKRHQTISVNL